MKCCWSFNLIERYHFVLLDVRWIDLIMRWISTEATHITILLLCYAFLTLPRESKTIDFLATKSIFMGLCSITWASYQIRIIAGCACAGNAGNVFPRRRFQRKPVVSDPGMHHGTCVTHVPWCMSGSLTCGDGENVPGITGACAPAISCIWQEAHGVLHVSLPLHLGTWCIKRCHSHCRNRLFSNIIRMVLTSWLAA